MNAGKSIWGYFTAGNAAKAEANNKNSPRVQLRDQLDITTVAATMGMQAGQTAAKATATVASNAVNALTRAESSEESEQNSSRISDSQL